MSDDDDECYGCICGAIRMAPCSHCENHLDENVEPTCDYAPLGVVLHRNSPCEVRPILTPRARAAVTRPLRPASVARDGAVWRWECRRCGCSDTRWRHHDAITEVRQHLDQHATFGFRGKGKR